MSDHCLLSEVCVGAGDDECPADLAEPVVGHADYRSFGHSGEESERLFDLGGVDVEATADVHVLESVRDAEVARVVDGPDITGVQPAVGVDGLCRGLGVIEVAQHHVRSTQKNLAGAGFIGVGDAHVEVGDRPPAGCCHRHRVVTEAAGRPETRSFGEAITSHYGVKVQFALDPLHQCYCQRGGAGFCDPQ